MKSSLILLSSLLIAACATSYNPRYYFNQIQVANLTGASVNQVETRVVASQKLVSCEAVANNAVCNSYFGRRIYPQQGIEVSWTHTDGSRQSKTLSPRVPAFFYRPFPLQIMIEIREDGSVNAFYQQEEPDGDGGIFTSF